MQPKIVKCWICVALAGGWIMLQPLHSFAEEAGPTETTTAEEVSTNTAPPHVAENWLTRRSDEMPERGTVPDAQSGAWRSMIVLVLLLGALIGAQYWLRRRAANWTHWPKAVRVTGRLRLGFRQELVLVEWDGEEMALGVGNSFIRCLHVRPARTETQEEEPSA